MTTIANQPYSIQWKRSLLIGIIFVVIGLALLLIKKQYMATTLSEDINSLLANSLYICGLVLAVSGFVGIITGITQSIMAKHRK